MSKRPGNNNHGQGGGLPGNRPRIVIPEGSNKIDLSKEAKTTITALDQAVAQAKFSLGNIEYQIVQLYKQRDETVVAIDKALKVFTSGVVSAAKELGINADDPTLGKWDFNTTTMAFTKVG